MAIAYTSCYHFGFLNTIKIKEKQSERKKSFLELKIVAKNYNELEKLIRCYEEIGFFHDGTSSDNGDVYVTFLTKNNGLIEINK